MNSLSELMVEKIEIWTSSENAKKSGRGRSTNLRSNLYGTNKLRDLILELAIKGRLVFQDESEDPASNILKKNRTRSGKVDRIGGSIQKKTGLKNIPQ